MGPKRNIFMIFIKLCLKDFSCDVFLSSEMADFSSQFCNQKVIFPPPFTKFFVAVANEAVNHCSYPDRSARLTDKKKSQTDSIGLANQLEVFLSSTPPTAFFEWSKLCSIRGLRELAVVLVVLLLFMNFKLVFVPSDAKTSVITSEYLGNLSTFASYDHQ